MPKLQNKLLATSHVSQNKQVNSCAAATPEDFG